MLQQAIQADIEVQTSIFNLGLKLAILREAEAYFASVSFASSPYLLLPRQDSTSEVITTVDAPGLNS